MALLSPPAAHKKEGDNLLHKLSDGSKLQVWSSSKQAWCLGTIESWRDEKEMNCSEAPSHRFATVFYEGRRKEVQLDDPEQARPDPGRMKGVVYDLDAGEFRARYDIPIPEPGPGEVRVKVLAAGLNPIDASIGEWKDLIVPPRSIRVASSSMEGEEEEEQEAMVPGVDVCGMVDLVGPEPAQELVPGEMVLYHGDMTRRHGALADYSVTDTMSVVKLSQFGNKPDATRLATTPHAGWTAYRAISDKLSVRPGDRIAIIGAAGGVGSFAVQMAAEAGAEQIIAVCGKKNLEYCASLGATHVITREQISGEDGGLRAALWAVTEGAGVDRILDCVGEETASEAYQALAFDGVICPLVWRLEASVDRMRQQVELMEQSTPRAFSPGHQYGTNYLDASLSHTWAQISLAGAHATEVGKLKLRQWGEEVTRVLCAGGVAVPLKSENVIECDQLEKVCEKLRDMQQQQKGRSPSSQGKVAVQMRPLKELISAMIQLAGTAAPEMQAAMDAVVWARKVKASMKPR